MSRLIETLQGGRRVDGGRRVLGPAQLVDAAPFRCGRPLPKSHAGGKPVPAPHFVTLPNSPPPQLASHDSDRTGASTGWQPVTGQSQPSRAPQLAHAPVDPPWLELDSESLEAYSCLLDRVSQAIDWSQPRSICFTSTLPGEGKTSVATTLALVAAMDPQRRVLVVDANLRNPQAAARVGIHPKNGLGDVLAEGVHPAEAICTIPAAGFDLLAAGRANRRAIELLGSRRMTVLLWDLKQSYDLIVVDAPHIAKQTLHQFHAGFDAILLVVQMLWTGPKSIHQALGLLRNQGLDVRACVLAHAAGLRASADSNDTGAAQPGHSTEVSDYPTQARPQTAFMESGAAWCANSDCETLPPNCDQSDITNATPDTTLVCSGFEVTGNPTIHNTSDCDQESEFQPAVPNMHARTVYDAPSDVGKPPSESYLETLRKLETLRPFDTESGSVTARDDESASNKEEGSASVAAAAPSFRIPRLSRRLLQSAGSDTEAAIVPAPGSYSWAADVLAFSGLMLIAASIFYVASDALLCF